MILKELKTFDVNQGFFYALNSETKAEGLGLVYMTKLEKKPENLPVEGQDFADPNEELDEKPSSHGEVANQKGNDFSELEESRMDNPPKKRDTNCSENSGIDAHTDSTKQENGVT